MARKIWSGKGELQNDEAHWEILTGKRRFQLVGRDYVRARVVAHLAKHCREKTREFRAAVIARTVDNDEWLGSRNGMVVQAICWDAYINSITEND